MWQETAQSVKGYITESSNSWLQKDQKRKVIPAPVTFFPEPQYSESLQDIPVTLETIWEEDSEKTFKKQGKKQFSFGESSEEAETFEIKNCVENMAETRALIQQVLDRLGGEAGANTIQQQIAAQQDRLQTLNNKQTSRNLLPEPFYGYSTEDPRKFLDKFVTYAGLQAIPDRQKVQTFRLLLHGPADVWYSTLDDAVKNDWAQFRQNFENHFGGQNVQYLLEQKLVERRQQPNELTEQYVHDIMQLAQRLRKGDNEIKQILLRGLRSDIKAFVIGQNPQTLADTLQKIKLGDTVSTINPASVSANCHSLGEKNMAEQLEKSQSTMASLAEEVKQVSQKMDKMNVGKSEVECFYCHKQGHLYKDCKARESCQLCGRRGHVARACYSLKSHINDGRNVYNNSGPGRRNAFNGNWRRPGVGRGQPWRDMQGYGPKQGN